MGKLSYAGLLPLPLHLVLYLHKCCQDPYAAQEALFDMSKAGVQSGLVSGSVM